MKYLTGKDWQEFFEAFPGAESWIMRRDLEQEHAFLKRCKEKNCLVNRWQEERLAELDEWAKQDEAIRLGRAIFGDSFNA